MFLPARMTRLVMGGHKDRMEDVIGLLHQEGILHMEDYEDPTGTTSIGTPLPAGDEASALLVRVRGLLKTLDAEKATIKALVTDHPAQDLAEAEEALAPTLEALAQTRVERGQADSERQALTPYENMDVDLGALYGLKSVQVYLGMTRDDPRAAFLSSGMGHEVQVEPAGGRYAVAVVVRKDDAPAADKILSEVGYAAANLPEAQGTPAQRIAELDALLGGLDERLQALEGDAAKMRESWGGRLKGLEQHLMVEVDRTQAPLHFAVTATTFHAEGWVPRKKVNRLQNAIAAQFGDSIYVEDLGDGPKGEHGHDDHDHHDVAAADEAPILLENPKLAKPYEFFLGLLGKPRYGEIDPTKLMLLFFPLFFGLMVGDVAVGLIIFIVGMLLKKRYVFGMGGPAVGKALMAGGFMAMLVGLLIFGEALGLHFVVDEYAIEHDEFSWEVIIYGKETVLAGGGFPTEGFIHKTVAAKHGGAADVAHAAAMSGEFVPLAVEGEETGISLKGHGTTHLSVNGWFNLGYYSKIHDIQALLIWSVLIGVVHVVIGLLLGVRNVRVAHGTALAIQEKASWLMILAAVPFLAIGAMNGNNIMLAAAGGVFVLGVGLLWVGTAKVLGVGFVAVLEVPGLFGNLLSYTRLAAIGASKAGMVIAFNSIGLLLSGGEINGLWWLAYAGGFLLIVPLSILAGTLQSLRLQFVEFFSKFYTGGGRPYVAFGRRAP